MTTQTTQNELRRCPHSKKCGGCQLQNLAYAEQLAWKNRLCIRLLGRFAHVEPILGMENPYHYRNKVQAAFGTTRAGRIISGIYQSSTHNIVAVDHCMTEDETADRIIVDIRRLLQDFKMTTYNEVTGRGFLRHVLVKRGFSTNEIMVVLVTGTPIFPARNNFLRALLQRHPEITTVVQNVNDRYTSMLLGPNEKTLYGPGYITDVLCGLSFRISAKSFYQINPVQTEVLYGKAIEFAELTGRETVIDAYCGIGTIGMIAAKTAGQVLGVEVNRDAVRDAIANAKRNNMQNIRFICADAGDFMVDMAQNGETCDVLLMDPPRAGSDQAFLASAVTLGPARIVYVSCNPETLARDLLFLTKRGYRVRKIQPVDMFPHTNHVECVVQLTRVYGLRGSLGTQRLEREALYMPMEEKWIAPCGFNCAVCAQFQKKKQPCAGCRQRTTPKSKLCVLKNCARESRVRPDTCAGCTQLPCSRLKAFDRRYRTRTAGYLSVIENLRRLEADGMASFLRHETAKWTCSSCGQLLCASDAVCRHCGHPYRPTP